MMWMKSFFKFNVLSYVLAALFTVSSYFSFVYLKDIHPVWATSFSIWLITIITSYFHFKKHSRNTNLIRNMKRKSNSMSGTGDQIYESCRQIDLSTNEQAEALFQVSSASEEIHAMAIRSGDNVGHAQKSVQSIHDSITSGSTNTEKLNSSFVKLKSENDNLTHVIGKAVENLAELTTLFNNVSEKAKVINDIVFQTKLLSFNASVEAARAGEHGKGFSVVAEEIGNLASMSGESAVSIQATLDETQKSVDFIINEIKSNSESAIGALQNRIDEGVKINNLFIDQFGSIQSESKTIKEQIEQVSLATSEQLKGIGELKEAIHLVSETVQRNNLVVSQTTDLSKLLNTDLEHIYALLHDRNNTSQDEEVLIEFLPWNKKYEIGVADMDNEHIELLKRINKLITAMNYNTNIQEAFDYMANYAIEHFKDEEEYMESIGYPSLDSHKKVHENLINAVLEYGAQIKAGTLNKPKLASFLKNWLFTHIIGVDAKYAEHSHEQKLYKKSA